MTETKKNYFWLVLSIGITIFIWHNSLQDAVNSERASLYFVALVRRLLAVTTASFSISWLDHVLRKLAHLTEFAALGYALMSLFVHLQVSKLWHNVGNVLALGFIIASVDECLQLFSVGRSCQLSDVCLDLVGVIVGGLVAWVVKRVRGLR